MIRASVSSSMDRASGISTIRIASSPTRQIRTNGMDHIGLGRRWMIATMTVFAITTPALASSSGVPSAWCNDDHTKLTFLNDGEEGVTLAELGKKPLECGYGNGPDGTMINCDGWTRPKVVFTIMSEPAGHGRPILIFDNRAWYPCKP